MNNDQMPYETATESLLNPTHQRQTGSWKRTLTRARYKHIGGNGRPVVFDTRLNTYISSESVPITPEIKLLAHLRLLPIDKLNRQSVRTKHRIAKLFRAVKRIKVPSLAAPFYAAIEGLFTVDNCIRREYLRRVEVQKSVQLARNPGC